MARFGEGRGQLLEHQEADETLVKLPIASAQVKATKLSLTVGDEKAYALLFQFAPKNAIAALAPGGSEQGELAAVA